MKQDIVLGIIRHLLTALGGILVTKGLADAPGLESAVGGVVALTGFVWSVIAKTRTNRSSDKATQSQPQP